jgi:hypothetical protein
MCLCRYPFFAALCKEIQPVRKTHTCLTFRLLARLDTKLPVAGGDGDSQPIYPSFNFGLHTLLRPLQSTARFTDGGGAKQGRELGCAGNRSHHEVAGRGGHWNLHQIQFRHNNEAELQSLSVIGTYLRSNCGVMLKLHACIADGY